MNRGVIFDVDGVLVDSYAAHLKSWQLLAAELGASFTEADFAATFGRTSRDIIREIIDPTFSDERIAGLDDRKEALFRALIADHFPAMAGAAALIAQLHEAGFALAVGSSGPPENVALVLRKLQVEALITSRITGIDVTRGKPDPQVFLLAADRLGLPAHHCVVVEDAPAGIAAAHAAGMVCIGLASTGRTHDDLVEAELVVDSLTELSPAALTSLTSSRG